MHSYTKPILATLAATLGLLAGPTAAAPTETGFTYQGRLMDGGVEYDQLATLSFTLFDDEFAGNPVGLSQTYLDVPVTKGLFTIQLDFGMNAFTGDERWLAIDVNGTALSPRQELTPAPYASFALNAPFQKSGSTMHYDEGFVGIGRSNVISGAEVFGIHKETANYGGMYVTTASGGEPFYGYKAGSETSMWTYATGTQWRLHNISTRIAVENNGNVGIGTTTPQGRLDVNGSLLANSLDVSGQTTLSNLDAASLDVAGQSTLNDVDVLGTLGLSGTVAAPDFEATSSLGSAAQPAVGGVYADNVVYAWAKVLANGSIVDSFGIASVQRFSQGHFVVTYDRPLNVMAVPIVTTISANDPILATIGNAGSTQCNVYVRLDTATGWILHDGLGFYIQVVGRP